MGRKLRNLIIFLALVAAAVWVWAGQRMSPDKLSAAINAAGIHCADDGQQSGEHFFLVPPTVLDTPEGTIYVYEFYAAPLAIWEARTVGNGGYSVSAALVDWAAPPHFYRRGSTMVQYVGNNEAVLDTLVGLMGQQFAGEP